MKPSQLVSGALWSALKAVSRLLLLKHILVLCVTRDEAALAGGIRDHKLKTRNRRVDRDERRRAIVVLARSHRTLPPTYVEHGLGILPPDRHLAERRVPVARRELRRGCRVRRDDEAFAGLRDLGF